MNGAARFAITGVLGACTFGLGCGGSAAKPAVPAPAASAAATAASAATSSTATAVVATGPSTLDSVYSADQASRGKDVYMGTCRSCHTAAFFTGVNFETHWKGKHLSELYTYVLTKMPGNDPGSLSPDATADVLAYVLQLNRMPPGTNELWPEADSLKKFRIDVSAKK
ncbi:MAG TPA: c-type cytochrome [Gemmatimonadaceae bacterium]|nr:c-type cytochrome [Gemmatimonadaceae bacterium]